MGKLEFLDALKRAMLGLPPETQARTLAYYEQRFVDGHSAGRSEADVARELDDPKKIAMTLRASVHMGSFATSGKPVNGLRVLASGIGLAIFNLFMVVPAAVYAALLVVIYTGALAFYVGGIAITASGLAGANELILRAPLSHMSSSDGRQTRISIDVDGIHVDEEDTPEDAAGAGDDDAPGVVRGAEAVAGRGVIISTDLDAQSRETQTFFGLGMVLGGILLFLLSLVVSRYTWIGLKRYVQMNLSLLRGT